MKKKQKKTVGERIELKRTDEIELLEREREKITEKIDIFIRKYARATGNYDVVKRIKRLSKSPNRWSFWHNKAER